MVAAPEPRPRTEVRIGPVRFAGPAVQAALSGYSDLPMRRVARAHGAPYALHEVVIDELLLVPGKSRKRVLSVPDDDHPVGGQLMGSTPETFGAAARDMCDAGFDVVDLNFGCPVGKQVGRCRGGFLLSTPEVAVEIVDRVLQAVQGDVPVSVKMRRGLDDEPSSEAAFFEILERAFDLGIAAVTVHGRTVRQRYVGPSSWPFLAKVKAVLGERTLLGSGDLFSAYAVRDMVDQTGVDGVTLARGCIGNPFLFEQVESLFAGRTPVAPSVSRQREAIELHARESEAHYGSDRGLRKVRRHAVRYSTIHPEPVRVRNAMVAVRSWKQLSEALDEFYGDRFASPQRLLTAADVVV